ncbi:MAG TPA: DUF1016 N-terminal domain-containing protein [Puia sp.]|jgi:hypothetical protein|nr:DUF1016 N-terminal domain-containing protein [Puia sp.]
METPKKGGMSELVLAIGKANQYFRDQAQRQVNTSLTLRNWIIGFYIIEYEQNGKDRAEYGDRLVRSISERLKDSGIKGLSHSNLQLYKQFYSAYPQLDEEVKNHYQSVDYHVTGIVQTVSGEFGAGHVSKLLRKLSFSHFIELMKADTALKRAFYETQAMVNNWSVRELQRAMDSMLFERTGLSKDKEAVLEKHRKGVGLTAEDIFRSPYMLDFLGLEEKPEYVETDLEGAIRESLKRKSRKI